MNEWENLGSGSVQGELMHVNFGVWGLTPRKISNLKPLRSYFRLLYCIVAVEIE